MLKNNNITSVCSLPRNRITKIVLFRLCMILFPPGRMWMLNKDGSKWKHIASAVENSKVVMMMVVVGMMLKLMRRRRSFRMRMRMIICWLWNFHENKSKLSFYIIPSLTKLFAVRGLVPLETDVEKCRLGNVCRVLEEPQQGGGPWKQQQQPQVIFVFVFVLVNHM